MKHQFGHKSGKGTYVDSEFGKEVEIYGSPTILDSQILSGKVFGGSIRSSKVLDNAIMTGGLLDMSILRDSSILADNACAINSQLWHESRLLDAGNINNVHLLNKATVCGTGMVIGLGEQPLILKEYDYVDRGIWYRRPVTYISEGGFVITENVGHLVTVSCTTNTVGKWLNGAGRRYGKLLGLSTEEIDFIEYAVAEIGKLKSQHGYDMMGTHE